MSFARKGVFLMSIGMSHAVWLRDKELVARLPLPPETSRFAISQASAAKHLSQQMLLDRDDHKSNHLASLTFIDSRIAQARKAA